MSDYAVSPPATSSAGDRRGPLRPEGLTVSRLRRSQGQITRGWAACALLLGLSCAALWLAGLVSVTGVLLLLAAGLIALHLLCNALLRRWRSAGRLTPNVVVVGATPGAQGFIRSALAKRDIAVLGVFDDRSRGEREVAGAPVLGDIEALIGHRLVPYIDRVVVAVPAKAEARVAALVERLSVMPNEISLIVGEDGAAVAGQIGARLSRVSGRAADGRRAAIKRGADLLIGGMALLIAAPFMLLIGLAIRLESPGPVFFRQKRHGFNNEEIAVWKFRSMRHDRADATASRQVTADDDRITRIGKILRPTSLDELPQIFNVLKGEMSLVGPRPHAIGMKTGDTESAKLVASYAHRHRMKPGMTGWAAIKGSRGPVDTPESVQRRVSLDVEYIERQSLAFDLYIMVMTIPCLLGDRSAVR